MNCPDIFWVLVIAVPIGVVLDESVRKILELLEVKGRRR